MARFRMLVADPASDPPLDEGALTIAAVGMGIDVDEWLTRLDDLAGDAFGSMNDLTPDALAGVVFVSWRIAGNRTDYGDPRNSYLPAVVERRLGLPITLSVLMIELGRRLGVGLHGVAMPGHFLVGVDGDPDCFFDPFHAGARLDAGGCRARFESVHGDRTPFHPSMLVRVGTRPILMRMLANLEATFANRRLPGARWAAELRLAFPELSEAEQRHSAEVLAAVGAFDRAAAVFEALADRVPESEREEVAAAARRYRARSN